MNNKIQVFGTLPALALAACAPMEQAPLVYSSTQTIGVDVSAGEPESPALSINIGYSGKDKAFVPVAVAKFCRARTSDYNHCLDDIFGIEVIKGNSTEDDGDTKPTGSLEFYTDERSRFKKIADNAAIEIKKLENTERQLGELQSLKSKNEDLRTDAEKQQILTLIESLDGVTSDDLKSEKSALTARKAKAEKDIADTGNIISGFLQQGQNFQKDEKFDALSVYGSFSGNANGDKDSAKIGVGKVFSTGVAAQHLTQGIGKAAVATACFDSGVKAVETLPEDKREAAMEKLFGICFKSSSNLGDG